MPRPIARPPHTVHSFQLVVCGSRTRAASSSVTWPAVTATRYDRKTIPRLKSFGTLAPSTAKALFLSACFIPQTCCSGVKKLVRRPDRLAPVNYRTLGRTGIRVSQLCLGTMPFGGDADPVASAKMYRACRDLGINFFDTADQYSKGRSEEVLGELVRGHRDDVIIATKFFNPVGPDMNARGGSRRHVARAVEAS